MRLSALAPLVLFALAGCQKKDPVIVDVDAAVFVNPFPSLVDRPIPSAPVADAEASAATGFADLFADDAAGGDGAALAKTPGFTKYANERFGFSVDVPKALVAKGPFADGTGNHWELGRQVAVTASAAENDALSGHLCPNGPDVTSRTETTERCTATGKREGMLFWERHVIQGKNDYGLAVEYRAELEKQMTPVLLHVQRSWTIAPKP